MSKFKVGDRVRVKRYAGDVEGRYTGLTGTLTKLVGPSLWARVILDYDPEPSAADLGLPVVYDEIEPVDG